MVQSPELNSKYDAGRTAEIEQQILNAPDQSEKARLQAALADQLDDSQKSRKLQLYTEAANIPELHNSCMARIFSILLKEAKFSIPDNVYTILDLAETEIADCCKALSEEGAKKTGFISRLFKGPKASGLYENVTKLTEYADQKPEIVSVILTSLAARIVRELNQENAVNLVLKIKTKTLPESVLNHILEAYLNNSDRKLLALRKQPEGQEADDLLAFYEKAAAVLHAAGDERAAALAGNIAVVYRHRKDEEKTYRYHLLSKTIFEEAGKTYDSLIESVNLATAYSEFRKTEQAIAVLRSCLSAALEKKEDRIAASAAGNLAAILTKHGGSVQEIRTCFEIEEKYYKNENAYRDLAISLYNQVIWNIQKTDPDMVSAAVKFKQFKKTVQAHHLQDFYSSMKEMEAFLLLS